MLRIRFDSTFDPYQHLALEHHYLYEDKDIEQSPVLLIYRNDPSVVFGNFQNPWQECDIPFCMKNNIKMVRRFSGGGCVYHDLGNINFCYISSKSADAKTKLTNLLVLFFKKNEVSLSIGDKSDLLLNGHKISGSAFRETKNASLHHCTLLFNTDLLKLKSALNSKLKQSQIMTKALPSRRSEVADLSNFKWGSAEDLIKDFILFLDGKRDDENLNLDPCQWKRWEQIWGKTPDFKLIYHNLEMHIQSGLLIHLSVKDRSLSLKNSKLPLALCDIVECRELEWKYQEYFKNIGLIV